MNLAALVLAIVLAAEPEPLRPAPAVAAISGHGGMAAGLDMTGALSVLRWPGPGGPDQIRQGPPRSDDATPASGPGGRWGVEIGGRWFWLGDPVVRTRQEYAAPGSAVLDTTSEWPESGVTVRQRAGVVPGQDVFLSAIEVRGANATPRAVWVAPFAPATRQIPEVPIGDGALDALNGFAAFVDRDAGRLWSFRPQHPGAAEWSRARALVASGALPEAWDDFIDGAWLGVAAGGAIANLAVAASMRELMDAIESGTPALRAAVGPSSAGIEPVMESTQGGFRAWIAVSAGANREAAARALDSAAAQATVFLFASPASEPAPSAIAPLDPRVLPRAKQHRAVLRTLHDPATGFTVRGLSAVPPLARDWPRDGALAAWALFELGDHAAAEKSIEAYLSKVRIGDRSRESFGSMPESLYTNGEAASAHFIVDDRGPARVLWVADRILRARGPLVRAAWIQTHWKPIEAAGEFLSTWFDARRGAPLYADDPVGLSDAETQDRLFADFGGMSAAIRLAESAGREVPEAWRVRREQLRALTEWVLKEPGRWMPGGSILLETSGIADPVLKSFAELVSRQIVTQIGPDESDIARLLLQAATLKEFAPELDAASFEAALSRIDSGESTTTPDSVVSSEILLAMLLRRGK